MSHKRKRSDEGSSFSRKHGRSNVSACVPSSSIHKKFIHNPLHDCLRQIRLLQILPGNKAHDLSFSIDDYYLEQAPPFAAISYTWGACTRWGYEEITINDRKFVVRKSCFQTLQQTLHQWRHKQLGSYYIWVDAICINQALKKEKAAQVSIMGDIYTAASHVLACVGTHADDSVFLFSKALETADFTLEYHECPRSEHVHMNTSQSWDRWAETLNNTSFNRLYEARAAFSKRWYWTRVWIIQEIARAKHVSIICGDSKLSLSALMNLDSFLSLEFSETRREARFWPDLMSRVLQQTRAGKMSIDEAFSYTDSGCVDPRDHLYGLLQLIEWPENTEPIFPDYDISTFDLALKVGSYVQLRIIPQMLHLFHVSPSDYHLRLLARNRRNERRKRTHVQERATRALSQSDFMPLYSHDCAFKLCGWIKSDHTGNLTASLFHRARDKDEPRSHSCGNCGVQAQALAESLINTITSRAPPNRKPQKLMLGTKVAGVLCPDTKAGDLLVPLPSVSPYNIYLVLRPNRETYYDTVGQALLLKHFQLGDTRPLRRNRAEAPVFSAQVELRLSAEDKILLYAMESCRGCASMYSSLTMRLFAWVTEDNCSAARVIKL